MEKIFKSKRIKITSIILASILGLLLIAWGVVATFYMGKAKPGTEVEGIDVAGKTKTEIINVVNSLYNNAIISATTEDGAKLELKFRDIAVTVDAEKTAERVIGSAKRFDIISRYSPYITKHNTIMPTYDVQQMKEKLNELFNERVSPPTDPGITWDNDANTFVSVAGKVGNTVNVNKVIEDIENNSLASGGAIVDIAFIEDTIKFEKEAADVAATTFSGVQKIKLVYEDETVFTIKTDKLASFVLLKENPETKEYFIDFDRPAIIAYLNKAVSDNLDSKPREQIEVTQKDGSTLVVQKGKKGQKLKNTEKLAEDIAAGITAGGGVGIPVEYEVADFTVRSMNGTEERWVEVNLSTQQTMLWKGNEKIATYYISSGRPATPTVTGSFAVYSQLRMQTMKGTNADGSKYVTPDVPWVTYFYADYAFHGCYWHSNFGNTMSHGCVNMPTSAAKTLYDFVDIGTKVYVHY